MTLLLFSLPGNESFTALLSAELDVECGVATVRQFPDGETYVRLETAVSGCNVAVVCTLDRPDDKILPLLFLAATARDLGAERIGLVAPYLAYMRQDRRFADGEGVTSTYFASLLSRSFDWLVTVDPHLHRRGSLSEIYSIPTDVIHAAPYIAQWIHKQVAKPLLVGPDSESEQWVSAVAGLAGAPYIVLEKTRHGDRDVSVSVPEVARWKEHTPVLVDDIISTARTMIETISHLKQAGLAPPVCVGVHGVFASGAYDALKSSGAGRIVTCNTIPHVSNEIGVARDIARAIKSFNNN